jgi:CRP-like cAMP-binding protein
VGQHLINKLLNFVDLSPLEKVRLDGLPGPIVRANGHERLMLPTEFPITLICTKGLLFRAVHASSGARQIVDILLPGDMLFLRPHSEEWESVQAERGPDCQCKIVLTSRLTELAMEFPNIGEAIELYRNEMERRMIYRIANLSSGRAVSRLADILSDFWRRASAAAMPDDMGVDFPLTQAELAELAGLTPIHVNRILQQLRKNGLIYLAKRKLKVLDWEALAEHRAL